MKKKRWDLPSFSTLDAESFLVLLVALAGVTADSLSLPEIGETIYVVLYESKLFDKNMKVCKQYSTKQIIRHYYPEIVLQS